MSAANAAAIRRRAAAPPNNIQVGQNQNSLRNGMTNNGNTQSSNSLPLHKGTNYSTSNFKL